MTTSPLSAEQTDNDSPSSINLMDVCAAVSFMMFLVTSVTLFLSSQRSDAPFPWALVPLPVVSAVLVPVFGALSARRRRDAHQGS